MQDPEIFNMLAVVLGVGLVISGIITILRKKFFGGPDGEDREYKGSEAVLWGAVHIIIGIIVVYVALFGSPEIKKFFSEVFLLA